MREEWRGSAVGRARRGQCQAEARLQTALETKPIRAAEVGRAHPGTAPRNAAFMRQSAEFLPV